MRDIEEMSRNLAAHEIVSCGFMAAQRCGKTADSIMSLIRSSRKIRHEDQTLVLELVSRDE